MGKRNIAMEAVNNDAYLGSCECPMCGKHITRGYDEESVFCSECGQKLHLRAFTKEEVDDALFEHEQDEYED